MDEPSKLQLIPTGDLIDELLSRYSAALFIGHKDSTKDHGVLTWDSRGNSFTLMGLAEHMRMRVNVLPLPENEIGEDDI